MFMLQRPTDEYFQRLGLKSEEFRAKFQEKKQLKKDEEKKFRAHLGFLATQSEQQEQQRQEKVRKDAERKILAGKHGASELTRSVNYSKADQVNKNLAKLKIERELREREERRKPEGYKGGRLPQNELVQKAQEKREEKKQRLLESVVKTNREQAKLKSTKVPQQLRKPRKDVVDDQSLEKQEQAATYEFLTANMNLKMKRLDKEKQSDFKMEEDCKRAASDLDLSYDMRRKQKQERFRMQQIPKEIAAQNLIEVKKQEATKAKEEAQRQAERYREEQLAKREGERQLRNRKEDEAKNTAMYWRRQMEYRQEQERAEKREEEEWFRKQCEMERVLKLKDKRKAWEKHQKQNQCSNVNNKMADNKTALGRCKEIQDRKTQERSYVEKRNGLRKNMDEEIHQAEEEKRILVPLLNQRERFVRPEDRLYASSGQDCKQVMRLKMTETHKMKNTTMDLTEQSYDEVCCTKEICGFRSPISPVEDIQVSNSFSESELDANNLAPKIKQEVRKDAEVVSSKYVYKPKEFYHKEATARHFVELKKQDAMKVLEEEERRDLRDAGEDAYKREKAKEKKAENEAIVQKNAAYWREQMNRRLEERKKEEEGKHEWFKNECETERILREKEQRKTQERRERQEKCNKVNKMIITENLLARRKALQEQKKGNLKEINEIEERIRRAKGENKIVLSPTGQQQSNDKLYFTTWDKCEPLLSKITAETRKNQQKNVQEHDKELVNDVEERRKKVKNKTKQTEDKLFFITGLKCEPLLSKITVETRKNQQKNVQEHDKELVNDVEERRKKVKNKTKQTEDKLFFITGLKCEPLLSKITVETRKNQQKNVRAHIDMSEEEVDWVDLERRDSGTEPATMEPVPDTGEACLKSSEAKMVPQNTVKNEGEEKQPSSDTKICQNSPMVQASTVQNNLNVAETPLKLPPIAPKKAPPNPKLLVAEDLAKRKTAKLKLPLINRTPKATLTSKPISSTRPKILNTSSVFGTLLNPIGERPVSPNSLTLMLRRPSLPPIALNGSPASGPKSITNSVRVIPLSTKRSK